MLRLFCLILLLACGNTAVYSQTKSEQHIKWSFMLGLTRFINWPNLHDTPLTPKTDSIDTPIPYQNNYFHLCFLGKTPYSNNSYNTDNIEIKGIPLKKTVYDKVLPKLEQLSHCNALYFSDTLKGIEVNFYLENIDKNPILTISDRSQFSESGGMIQFVMINRKMRFKLNLNDLQKTGLEMHPSVIKLALPGENKE